MPLFAKTGLPQLSRLYVDAFSIAASLPEKLFKSAAEPGADAALKARRCAVLLFQRGKLWLVSKA
ncbi:hypothetical protein [Pyrobaculum sp.]|uniref:hypothetical protein n=1 Tax=Pyrobaculum sp. TaxID=2004705 RepID=UPI0031651127